MVVAFGALLAGPAEAADGPLPLRLEDLVAEIRRSNPSAAAAARRVEAARIRIPRARALADPFVQGMVEDVPARLRGGMPMVRVFGTQMLPWFGKRDRMAAVAEREADAAAARADVTVLDVVVAGKRAYHELVLNRQARAVNREQRAIVDTVIEIATGRLRSGSGMHHDVLKMQTEATMLDDELVMLEGERREMAAMVNALIDRPAQTPVAEPEEAWTPAVALDRGRLVAAAVVRRPELREMAFMEAAERAMAEAARREYYPDVMIGGLYDIKSMEPNTFGGMLGLNVPIWIGSRQRLDVRAAETRARAVERERAGMAAMVRGELERHLARVEVAERRARLLETEFTPRAQQTFDSALRAFPSGMVDALSLLDSLRALEAQKLKRIALRIDRELALVDLERAIGVPLEELR